jgi:hypothetical protein
MKGDFVRQITLYKYRYVVGLGGLFLFILVVAAWRFWTLPSGLSEVEMSTAAAAGDFSCNDILASVVNLPYLALEWLSIKVFGAGALAFRLPSVILMVLTGVGLVLFLFKWTRKNIAIISSFWAVSSILYIGLSRSGAPAAMTTFLIMMILLAALTILRAVEKIGEGQQKNQVRRNWQTFLAKIILCVALALLCYQTAGIYLATILVLVGTIHPKTRLIFLRSSPLKFAVSSLIGLLVLLPLAIGLVSGGQSALREWLVLDGAWSLDHLATLGLTLVGFESASIGGLVIPLITFVGLVIAVLGLMKVSADVLSARAYLTLSLLIGALALSAWQPSLVYLLFVPLTLLVTAGIEAIIRKWYDLFPRNPYARVFALLPLAILIGGLVWTNTSHYLAANNYSPAVVYSYHQELAAVRQAIAEQKSSPVLVVAERDKAFYEILQSDFPTLTVATEIQENSVNIVLDSANVKTKTIPRQIVTNSNADKSVILRIY